MYSERAAFYILGSIKMISFSMSFVFFPPISVFLAISLLLSLVHIDSSTSTFASIVYTRLLNCLDIK